MTPRDSSIFYRKTHDCMLCEYINKPWSVIGVRFCNLPQLRWRNSPAQLASSLGGQIGVVSSSRTVTSTRASTLVSSCADPPSLEKHCLEKASRILIWLARLVAPASPSSRNTSDIFWSCGHLPVLGRNFVIVQIVYRFRVVEAFLSFTFRSKEHWLLYLLFPGEYPI